MIIKLPLAPAPLLLVRLAAARPFSVRRRCGFFDEFDEDLVFTFTQFRSFIIRQGL
mgnify:CR=1 FL=1